MLKKPSVLYVAIAAVALSVGLLVYLLDRQPEHVYFLSFGLTAAHAPHALFGVAGNYLPAFLHVYAFMLLTVAVAGSSNARLIRIGAAWLVIASLFEFGQHPGVSPHIAASLPAWFAHLPVLDNTAAYFLRGTFDPLDFLSIAAGTVVASLTVALIRNSAAPRAPNRSRYSVFRYLALGGTSIIGMLAIIGSGGDEGDFNFGSDDDSLIYVGGNASDTLLVYESANSVSGNTVASRTVAGGITTLDEPRGIAVDMARNRIYVANAVDNSILVFSSARTMTGDIAPARTISGGTLNGPTGLFLDVVNDRLYVTNNGGDSVLVYDSASTAIVPTRTLAGAATDLDAPTGIYADTTRNLLYVATAGITNQILVFNNAATVNGNIAPARSIPVSSAPAGIFVDVIADRLYVASGNTILIFDGASTANSASTPDRTISGGGSMLNQPRDIFVDTGTNRLYVANAADDTVLVFNNASTASGSPAPGRILNLPTFTDPWGIYVDVTPIVIGSTASRDGYVLDDGSSVNTDPVDDEPKTGDVEDEIFGAWRHVARQFYSFELAGIPSSVSVQSAMLRLYQANAEGSPYGIGNLGSIIVDHVNYGNSLDIADYDVVALTSSIGTLSTDASQAYKTLSVATSVASDILASRSRSQYRLRFSDENSINFANDYIQFTDAEDSCCAANRPPQLVITIQP
jgi:DNA-binding beta-propeller fold protein YncE